MRLKRLIALAMGQMSWGCAANPAPQPQAPELFASPLSAPPPYQSLACFWSWLAGLVLGLALGCCLAHLWRRRSLARALQDPGLAPPHDLARLQAILDLMDELALGWRRRRKIKPLRGQRPPPGP